jgi:hypothetical protein
MSKDYAQQVVKWANDPEIRALTGSHFPRTLESVKKQLEDADTASQKVDEIWFGIWHCADKALIGEASLNRINWPNRSANLSVTIGEKTYWNRGLGTEVARLLLGYGFEELQLHKMKAFFLAENAPAQKVVESLNMHYELSFHEQVFFGFTWHDLNIYGIFDREWLSHAQVVTGEDGGESF